MVTRPFRLTAAAFVFSGVIAVSAYAQDFPEPAPAPAPPNLAYVEGTVDVVQDGVTRRADPPMILIEGDIVRTRDGRAEIVFGDGTLMHLGERSEVEVLADQHLRFASGRAIVRLSREAARPYVIDTPASSVRLEAEGEYSLSADASGRLEVAVVRGSATLGNGSQWTIRGGQMVSFEGAGSRPLIDTFNSAQFDPFERWAYERTNDFSAAYSAAQLPYELRPYARDFDEYGRWDYVAPHGYVWFPSVAGAWRPYYDGWWSSTKFGWTWHGRDRWAWPTHHYGRWGFNGAFWFWIPGNLWAPAWVSWTVASGYVGWAPLGWHSSGFWRPDHPAYSPHYSPWRGWTIVHRDHFRPRRHVRLHAVDGDRLDEPVRRALIDRAVAIPRTNDFAVPRNAITVPGARGSVRQPGASAPADVDVRRPGRRISSGTAAPRAGAQPAPPPPSTANGVERRGAVRGSRVRGTTVEPPRVASPGDDSPQSTGGSAGAVPRDTPPRPVTPSAGTRDTASPARSGGAVRRAPAPERRGGDASTSGQAGSEQPRGGAVRRTDGARSPARGAPAPSTQAPSSQSRPAPESRPAPQGGARRRPGGS